MSRIESLAETITSRRRTVIAVVLVVTLLLGSGIHALTISTSLDEFRGGTVAAEKDEYVRSNFGTGAPNSTRAMVLFRADRHILTKEHYLNQLRAQQAMRENETVNETLVEEDPTMSLANVVATISIKRNFRLEKEYEVEQEGGQGAVFVPVRDQSYENISVKPMPPLERQIEEIENMDRGFILTYTAVAFQTVLTNPGHGGPEGGALSMASPKEIEDNDGGIIESTTMVVSQRDDITSQQRTRSQVAIRDIVDRETDDYVGVSIFGTGVINAELERSTVDSLLLVGPIAVLFVVIVLFFAYRDWWDIALGVIGLGLVQLWTFGFMGWAGITFNQLFAAAPVLLVGLAIDYAIHVFMRYREERAGTPGESLPLSVETDGGDPGDEGAGDGTTTAGDDDGSDPGVQAGMAAGLGGLLAALGLVTLTTAIGFSSNVASPVLPIREFGLVTAVGIVASLAVFGMLVPAVKVELDRWLEDRGEDRQLAPFGTEGQGERFTELLGRTVAVARDTPWVVVGLAAILATSGVLAGMQVDTSFEQDELLVHEVPDIANDLPEPFRVRDDDYLVYETLTFLKDNDIAYDGAVAHVLVQGDVTRPDTLERLKRAEERANRSDAAVRLPVINTTDWRSYAFPGSGPAVTTPLTAMREAAANNETFNRTFHEADTDGDGVPDRNIEEVYDTLYETDPLAAQSLIHREDGEYRALRVTVFAKGNAANHEIKDEMEAAAQPADGDELRAYPTGEPVMLAVVSDQLLRTIVLGMFITLFTVLALLMAVYWRLRGSASLGVVTILPVVLALTLIVGTMHVIGLRFNIMTALITSFTIGMGVDYAIHVSERYVYELERHDESIEALRASVLGTGGALLGSAATTAGGFAVLVFSILNPLQQFGVVTALTIVFAFFASVLVLPSLLVLWTRHLRPAHHLEPEPATTPDPEAGDD